MSEQLPKGITRLENPTPAHAAANANVQTAATLHTDHGHDIEKAAAWLMAQLPGIFESVAAAVAAIRKKI